MWANIYITFNFVLYCSDLFYCILLLSTSTFFLHWTVLLFYAMSCFLLSFVLCWRFDYYTIFHHKTKRFYFEVEVHNSEDIPLYSILVTSPTRTRMEQNITDQNRGEKLLETFRVGVRVPPFYPEKPSLWFSQMEAQFALSNIKVDDTKYYVIGHSWSRNTLLKSKK